MTETDKLLVKLAIAANEEFICTLADRCDRYLCDHASPHQWISMSCTITPGLCDSMLMDCRCKPIGDKDDKS